MAGSVVAGLDVGTTGIRCVLYSKDLDILASSYERVSAHFYTLNFCDYHVEILHALFA